MMYILLLQFSLKCIPIRLLSILRPWNSLVNVTSNFYMTMEGQFPVLRYLTNLLISIYCQSHPPSDTSSSLGFHTRNFPPFPPATRHFFYGFCLISLTSKHRVPKGLGLWLLGILIPFVISNLMLVNIIYADDVCVCSFILSLNTCICISWNREVWLNWTEYTFSAYLLH